MRSVIMEVPKQPCIIEVLMLASLSSRIAPSWFQQPLCIDLPTPIPAPNTSPEALPEKASIGSPREFGFGVLSAICKPELIDEVLAGCGRLERRCRLLPARLMVYALLLMCLRANLSYDKLMHHLAGAAGTPGSWSPPHKSAFFRARLRLGSEVMEHLFRALARPLADPRFDGGCFWRGRRVVAVDGTTIELPAVPELEQAFGGPTVNDGMRSGLPQARVVTLIECGTRALLDAELGHYLESENTLAARLVRSITAGMILLADRGFPSKALWALFSNAGADLVWRAKEPIATRVVKHLSDGSYLASFGMGQPLTLRVIEYALVGSDEVYRLLTNLLDPEIAPALELAALYAERWEVEILIKEVKVGQCIGRPLRSQTEVGVRQEFWAHCVLHQISRQLVYQAAATIPDRDPDRISFSLAQDAIRRSVSRATGLTARKLSAALQHAVRELTMIRALITRRDRAYPRVVRNKWPRFPGRAKYPSATVVHQPRRPQIIVCGA
jgi:hypothetical protein